jgi:hypothetical protein
VLNGNRIDCGSLVGRSFRHVDGGCRGNEKTRASWIWGNVNKQQRQIRRVWEVRCNRPYDDEGRMEEKLWSKESTGQKVQKGAARFLKGRGWEVERLEFCEICFTGGRSASEALQAPVSSLRGFPAWCFPPIPNQLDLNNLRGSRGPPRSGLLAHGQGDYYV